MKTYFSALVLATTALFAGCAGSKAKAQEQVVNCDIMFEYHAVENDSISLLVGNTLWLHTGKALPGRFYPLIISVRNPRDLDRPTSTEVISDDAALLELLHKGLPLFQTIGVIIDDNTSTAKSFSESDALAPIKQFAKLVPDARILLFHEKAGDVISVETVKEGEFSAGTMPRPAQTGL